MLTGTTIDLIRQLQDDPKHVQHIQNFWGDELTRGAAQSADGKAAYVQLNLAGKQGEPLGTESVEAVQHIVGQTPAPPGVNAMSPALRRCGWDMSRSGDRTVNTITAVSLAVIFVMLLLVYRSFITVILLLLVVGIEVQVSRGIIAFLGHHEIIGLTTFAVNLLIAPSSRLERTTGYFSSGGIRRHARPARIGKRLTTPLTAGSPRSSWPPV